MDKVIVLIDDVAYAQDHLRPMLGRACGVAPAALLLQHTHWVVVACPPRITHHVSKFVSHSAREHWRTKWFDTLCAELAPWLQQRGDRITPVLAKEKLMDLSARLMAEHGATRVLDARRPKLGQDLQPVTADQPAPSQSPWALPGTVAGIGFALVLAAD